MEWEFCYWWYQKLQRLIARAKSLFSRLNQHRTSIRVQYLRLPESANAMEGVDITTCMQKNGRAGQVLRNLLRE